MRVCTAPLAQGPVVVVVVVVYRRGCFFCMFFCLFVFHALISLTPPWLLSCSGAEQEMELVEEMWSGYMCSLSLPPPLSLSRTHARIRTQPHAEGYAIRHIVHMHTMLVT